MSDIDRNSGHGRNLNAADKNVKTIRMGKKWRLKLVSMVLAVLAV